MADVAWLTAPERAGRGSRAPESRVTARWLVAELTAAGLAVQTRVVPEIPDQDNVIAIWPGSSPPAAGGPQALLVVAHYDHLGRDGDRFYPGADDNASGVAVALAVARDLAARRHLTHPIVFLFSAAEELGLIGARAYADDPVWPLSHTRAVINLDMVGRRFFELAVDRDAAVGVVGLGDDAVLDAAVQRAAGRAGLALVPASPALLTAVGQGWRGDDWAFRRPGLPAVHFSTGMHGDYHQSTDTADRLAPAQMLRVTRLLQFLLMELD